MWACLKALLNTFLTHPFAFEYVQEQLKYVKNHVYRASVIPTTSNPFEHPCSSVGLPPLPPGLIFRCRRFKSASLEHFNDLSNDGCIIQSALRGSILTIGMHQQKCRARGLPWGQRARKSCVGASPRCVLTRARPPHDSPRRHCKRASAHDCSGPPTTAHDSRARARRSATWEGRT